MKVNKDLIISKTITFICVVLFISIFKSVFGAENTLIGVTTITAALMFLERDLTLNPIENTIRLITINLLIGIGATLASSNMYVGIISNFIVLFIISYIFCYNLRSPMYIAFSLQYLFILANPVTGDKIILRFLSLITGALLIMLLQILFNKNKLAKTGNMLLSKVCDLIIGKIHIEEGNIHTLDPNNDINNAIDAFRSMVYDKREYNYYLTHEGRVKLNLSVALENLNAMLSDENISKIDSDILNELEYLIKEVKNVLSTPKKEIEFDDTSKRIKKLLSICEDKNTTDLLNLQLLDSMILLSDTLESLKQLDVEHYNLVNKTHEITDIFSDESIKDFLSDRKSIRYCYAMRVSITLTIGAFIMDYFKFPEGRWMLFTILSVITPLYETSKSKTKDRVFATIVGSIIVALLFTIFKDTLSRMIIITAAGYLNGYFREYKYATIFVTISAIGSAALIGNVQILTINRIFFVFLGAILALAANKFLFPYRLSDSINQLREMYHNAIVKMLKEVENLVEGKSNPHTMKNLLIVTSLIDSKARSNESIANSKSYSSIITERRNLVTNIYELYIFILKDQVKSSYKKEIISDLEDLIQYKDEDISWKINHLKTVINSTKDMNTKIILSSMAVILEELRHLSELNKTV